MLSFKNAFSILIAIISGNTIIAQNSITIQSPNKKITTEIIISKDGLASYSIKYLNETAIEKSQLGLIMEEADFSKGLTFTNASATQPVKDEYNLLTAKKSHIVYQANKKIISLRNAAGKKMDVVFQVSNDGVAFKYAFNETSKDVKNITSEATSFHFPEGSKAWLQPKTEAQSGWEHSNPSY